MDKTGGLFEIVGRDRVFDDPVILENNSRDFSLSPSGMPDCVVRARNVEDVQKVLIYAKEHSIPVIPSSSAVHFYGATIPQKGGILLDLTEMDRVLEIDELNRRVRVEAGVTWKKLTGVLEKKGLRTVMPLFPHPSRSVVTDFLEREVITNTVYEYGEPLQGMEVVWPNGEVFRTGSASVKGYPESVSKGVNPSGPGLDFYRLLQGAQGTMGVVTWANLKVESLPERDRLFFAPLSSISEGIEFITRILRLRVGQESFFLNNMNLTLICQDDFEKVRCTFPSWTLIIILSGLQRRPEEKLKYDEDLLRRIRKEEFPEIPLLEDLPGFPCSGHHLIKMLRSPWPETATYWKHRYKGGCQSLFFITRPVWVSKFIRIVKTVANQHGYPEEDLGGYIQPIEQNRACHLEFLFFYDRENASEKERINKLYKEAVITTLDGGAHFTRPYGEVARRVYERAPEYARALRRVKRIFDPGKIMNPGRLCF